MTPGPLQSLPFLAAYARFFEKSEDEGSSQFVVVRVREDDSSSPT